MDELVLYLGPLSELVLQYAPRRIAIVGGRDFTNYTHFCEQLLALHSTYGWAWDAIVSGGAGGTDTMARRFARSRGYALKEWKPDYSTGRGKAAPLDRNTSIVQDSHLVIAFPTKQSRGTWDTIRKARALGRGCLFVVV